MIEQTEVDQLNLPQHSRPMAVQARLLALLEGLGIPHAPTWLSKPVKEFYTLGEMYLYKLQGKEPPPERPEDIQPPGN